MMMMLPRKLFCSLLKRDAVEVQHLASNLGTNLAIVAAIVCSNSKILVSLSADSKGTVLGKSRNCRQQAYFQKPFPDGMHCRH
jgi:hypothetical protein